ncbi:unnamed protein product [Calicophoron daubneyi]|uniref:HAUS augmin-like complex subunit 6 N-terminal domain-containing protein n=1 Tax=Calicophoron daubneyi TaxID=300641 RepID=A0AAV2TRL6_CALDB
MCSYSGVLCRNLKLLSFDFEKAGVPSTPRMLSLFFSVARKSHFISILNFLLYTLNPVWFEREIREASEKSDVALKNAYRRWLGQQHSDLRLRTSLFKVWGYPAKQTVLEFLSDISTFVLKSKFSESPAQRLNLSVKILPTEDEHTELRILLEDDSFGQALAESSINQLQKILGDLTLEMNRVTGDLTQTLDNVEQYVKASGIPSNLSWKEPTEPGLPEDLLVAEKELRERLNSVHERLTSLLQQQASSQGRLRCALTTLSSDPPILDAGKFKASMVTPLISHELLPEKIESVREGEAVDLSRFIKCSGALFAASLKMLDEVHIRPSSSVNCSVHEEPNYPPSQAAAWCLRIFQRCATRLKVDSGSLEQSQSVSFDTDCTPEQLKLSSERLEDLIQSMQHFISSVQPTTTPDNRLLLSARQTLYRIEAEDSSTFSPGARPGSVDPSDSGIKTMGSTDRPGLLSSPAPSYSGFADSKKTREFVPLKSSKVGDALDRVDRVRLPTESSLLQFPNFEEHLNNYNLSFLTERSSDLENVPPSLTSAGENSVSCLAKSLSSTGLKGNDPSISVGRKGSVDPSDSGIKTMGSTDRPGLLSSPAPSYSGFADSKKTREFVPLKSSKVGDALDRVDRVRLPTESSLLQFPNFEEHLNNYNLSFLTERSSDLENVPPSLTSAGENSVSCLAKSLSSTGLKGNDPSISVGRKGDTEVDLFAGISPSGSDFRWNKSSPKPLLTEFGSTLEVDKNGLASSMRRPSFSGEVTVPRAFMPLKSVDTKRILSVTEKMLLEAETEDFNLIGDDMEFIEDLVPSSPV